MLHSSNLIQNINIITNTFDIVDGGNVTLYTVANNHIRDIIMSASKTEIKITFRNQTEPIVLSGFGNVGNITTCLILLKKTSSSLKNKHFVDVMNYSEGLVERIDFYHYYNPDNFIYSIDNSKKEIILKDSKAEVSIILHPNPYSIIRRNKKVVKVVNGVTDEETTLNFTSVENAVIGVEHLNDAFKVIREVDETSTEDVYEHIQSTPSKTWVVFYGTSKLANHDSFSTIVYDEYNNEIDADVHIDNLRNVVTISFDFAISGKVKLVK